MIKIIHSSILCKWAKPTKSARDQIIIAATVLSVGVPIIVAHMVLIKSLEEIIIFLFH